MLLTRAIEEQVKEGTSMVTCIYLEMSLTLI